MEPHQELILALGRVEGKIDSFAQSQVRHEGRLDAHDKRLSTLERWQAKVIGIGAAAGAIASGAIQYVFRS